MLSTEHRKSATIVVHWSDYRTSPKRFLYIGENFNINIFIMQLKLLVLNKHVLYFSCETHTIFVRFFLFECVTISIWVCFSSLRSSLRKVIKSDRRVNRFTWRQAFAFQTKSNKRVLVRLTMRKPLCCPLLILPIIHCQPSSGHLLDHAAKEKEFVKKLPW